MPLFFLQNDENYENVKKNIFFLISKREKRRDEKKRGEIEKDGKKGGGFIDSFRQTFIIITLTIFFLCQNQLLPFPLKLELQKALLIFHSTEALGCASVEKILT